MLHGMGIHTGVDQQKLTSASQFIQEKLGRPLPSKSFQAASAKLGGKLENNV
jgi:hydroxymethylglutaryl-CoA lyase